MSDIETLPKGDDCQCAECRTGRGDTQFAEFMARASGDTRRGEATHDAQP